MARWRIRTADPMKKYVAYGIGAALVDTEIKVQAGFWRR